MANKNRWKYGDTKPVIAVCNEGQAIEIGDLCYMEGAHPEQAAATLGDARPASGIPWQGSLAETRRYFACRFLGHASQQHRANHDPADDTELRFNTAGVHEYVCSSQQWEIGDLVAPAVDAAGTGLQDQAVCRVTSDDQAIGRVAKREAVANTRVYVELVSEVMHGGVDGETCSGSSSSGE